ncbi:MAG TPA: VWA domain-containing protein, partial [Vicinamibacterales bacterium]|nr:VWA domain-containing protein [Vicinamibacterales bacterium]
LRVGRSIAPCLVAALAASVVAIAAAQQTPTFKAGIQTVAVYATVTGADGRLVTDLPRDAFTILDKGKPQPITVFANEQQPITVVMLLDRSGSMRANFRLVQQAAEAFVADLQPLDKARIGSFANGVQVNPEDFTTDHDELLNILRTNLQPEGPTPLWNAVDIGISALIREQGRRVILVFTDGVDAPGNLRSDNTSFGAVMKRAEEQDVMVYAIGLAGQQGAGGGFGRGGSPGRMEKPDAGLAKIAAATGGGYFELTSADDLATTFHRVADELHHQYALGFAPTELDGTLHPLEVRISGTGLVARARKSYLAANTPPPPPLPMRVVPLSAIQSAFRAIEPSTDLSVIRTWVGMSRGETGRTRITFVWEPAPPVPGEKTPAEPPARVVLTASADGSTPYFDDVVPDAGAAAYGGIATGRIAFDVPPGPLQARLFARDQASKLIGTATRSIAVPDLANAPLALGTPQVLRARTVPEFQKLKADPDAVPTATRQFSRANRLLVRVPVYSSGTGPPPALRARLLNRAGQVIAALSPEPAPVPGVQQIEVPTANLAPSDYLVDIQFETSSDQAPTALVGLRVTN